MIVGETFIQTDRSTLAEPTIPTEDELFHWLATGRRGFDYFDKNEAAARGMAILTDRESRAGHEPQPQPPEQPIH